MLADALSQANDELDRYLTDPEWRSHYDGKVLTRADVLRAAIEAMRGYLDTLPETSDALEAAISGDLQSLDRQIAAMGKEWHTSTPPNMNFSPNTFRAWALAAVQLLRVIDTHLVPLLPDLGPLAPKPQED